MKRVKSDPAIKVTEQSLGVPIKAWFEAHGWTVYQEVEHGPGIADIVATLGPLLAVVEIKTSLSFDVIAQGHRWLNCAHWSWVAVPAEKGRNDNPSDGRHLAYNVCKSYGIGVLRVRPLNTTELHYEASGGLSYRPGLPWCFESNRVAIAAPAAIQRRADVDAFRAKLKPEHQTFAPAGMQSGKRWTPFTATCERLRRFLVEQGGSATIAAAIKQIDHHYSSNSSARSSLAHWIEKGSVDGIQLDLSGAVPTVRAVALGMEAPIQRAPLPAARLRA